MALTIAKTALQISEAEKPHESFPDVHSLPTSAPPALWQAGPPSSRSDLKEDRGEDTLRHGPVSHGTCVLLGLVEATDLADAANPFVHVVLSLSHQVEGPVTRLDVEDVAVLQLLLVEGEASIHLLTEIEVDDTQRFFGVVIFVVFQDVGVTTHPTAAQDKPAFLPCLKPRQEQA